MKQLNRDGSKMHIDHYCQAQFQLAIAVAIELSLALLSLLNRPPTCPPTR
jgi:hypothetical protein